MIDQELRNKINKFMDDWLWEFIPGKEDNLLNAEGQLWKIIDDVSDSAKEECAMIFENQISDENTDKANTNLRLNAQAIRED